MCFHLIVAGQTPKLWKAIPLKAESAYKGEVGQAGFSFSLHSLKAEGATTAAEAVSQIASLSTVNGNQKVPKMVT